MKYLYVKGRFGYVLYERIYNRKEILVGGIYKLFLFEIWIDNDKVINIYVKYNSRYYRVIGFMKSFEIRIIFK